jgi:hypothetical protein
MRLEARPRANMGATRGLTAVEENTKHPRSVAPHPGRAVVVREESQSMSSPRKKELCRFASKLARAAAAAGSLRALAVRSLREDARRSATPISLTM